MPPEYTKREIDLKFEVILEKISLNQKTNSFIHSEQNDKLDKILAQTTAHNGRMRTLEQWRWFITGGLTILSILIVPIVLSYLI